MSLVVGAVSLSLLLVACGDASSSSGVQRRPNPTLLGNGVDDGQPSNGEDTVDPGNPNANAPPAAPTDPGKAAAEMSVAVSAPTAVADLGGSIDITVTVTPKGTFAGDVDLSAAGLPAGATGTFTPAKLTLAAGAPGTAKLTIKNDLAAVPSAKGASSALVVTATSGAVTSTANVAFKVNPALKMTIPLNIDALRSAAGGTGFLDQWGAAFGTNPTPLKTQVDNAIVVTVYNADSKAHIMHGNGGFAHGSTVAGQEIQPNAFELQGGTPRVRSFLPGTNVNGYPHEGANGPSASWRMTVVAAP